MRTYLTNKNVFVLIIIVACILTGCPEKIPPPEPPPVKKPVLSKLCVEHFPKFIDDINYEGLEQCIAQSISYLKRVSPSKKFNFGEDVFDATFMIKSLNYFSDFIKTKPSQQKLSDFIKSNYIIYQSIGKDDKGQVLFTGYYEPTLQGSLKKSAEYKFPVYARPSDLRVIDLSLFSSRLKGERIVGRCSKKKFVPYYSRREIENKGALKGKAKQLAWVNNCIDLFFLQIQGSGKIHLDNGEIINVHYHTSNGKPYRSIGNWLIRNGKISKAEMSMQKIRTYLLDYPKEIDKIFNYNPSYVFFKIEREGPLGCLEVVLTPSRSLATDRRIFPSGALAFIETKKPLLHKENNEIYQWINFSRFVLNQDTGGAIKGAGRADIFWGNGKYAEIAAGHMQHIGKLYFLILKPNVA